MYTMQNEKCSLLSSFTQIYTVPRQNYEKLQLSQHAKSYLNWQTSTKDCKTKIKSHGVHQKGRDLASLLLLIKITLYSRSYLLRSGKAETSLKRRSQTRAGNMRSQPIRPVLHKPLGLARLIWRRKRIQTVNIFRANSVLRRICLNYKSNCVTAPVCCPVRLHRGDVVVFPVFLALTVNLVKDKTDGQYYVKEIQVVINFKFKEVRAAQIPERRVGFCPDRSNVIVQRTFPWVSVWVCTELHCFIFLSLEFTSQSGVQVFLVDLVDLLVPVVVCQ